MRDGRGDHVAMEPALSFLDDGGRMPHPLLKVSSVGYEPQSLRVFKPNPSHPIHPSTRPSFLVFAIGVCCTTPLVCLFVRPLLGSIDAEPKFDFAAYARAPTTSHRMGCLGGIVWAVGTVSSLTSGKAIGMALSYSIGQR